MVHKEAEEQQSGGMWCSKQRESSLLTLESHVLRSVFVVGLKTLKFKCEMVLSFLINTDGIKDEHGLSSSLFSEF